jgi:branched-subunit amino acid ABC-type transport system permease component
MTNFDVLLQQTINGLSLGAMYSLLALGFTLVYGILELINFSHFNVFMVGSFIAMGVLQMFGLTGQNIVMTGLPLVGVLFVTFAVTMLGSGVLGGIGNVPGAMVGGLIIGLVEAMSGQFIATEWTDVIIFSILVLVLVFRPAGLFGRLAPNKS